MITTVPPLDYVHIPKSREQAVDVVPSPRPQWCDGSSSACKQTARKCVHESTLERVSTQLQSSGATLSMKSLCSDTACSPPSLSPLLPAPSMSLIAPLHPSTPPLLSYSFCCCSRLLGVASLPPAHLIPQRIHGSLPPSGLGICPRSQTFTLP